MAHDSRKDAAGTPEMPEGFLWPTPQWFRSDRARANPVRFVARVLIGGLLGLLFGRVLGSLQGLFLQWVYEGLGAAVPGLEGSLGRGIHAIAVVLGAVYAPLLAHSPLKDSLVELRASGTGAASLLFLAQLHGSLNGLYQGVKPAVGDRLQAIVEPIILSWGLVWHWLSWPIRAAFFRPPSPAALRAMLADAGRPSTARALRTLLRRGLLPAPADSQLTEGEILAAWPGKIPADAREAQWKTKPGLRTEVYRWIETNGRTDALVLLARGLDDPDEDARTAAVTALASLGVPGSIPHLVALLDEQGDSHNLAVQGLRRCAQAMES